MDKKHKSDSGQKKKTVKKNISDTDIVITSSKLKRDIHRILISTKDMKKLTPRLIKDELKKSYEDEVIDKYNKLIKGWIKELYSELSKKQKVTIKKKRKKHTEEIGEEERVTSKDWVLPNRKLFLSWIDRTFNNYRLSGKSHNKGCTTTDEKKYSLFPYQKFIRDYIQFDSPYRGLLLYHGLGSGKSCSSVAVAEGLKNDMGVIVMLPASLEENYYGELKKC